MRNWGWLLSIVGGIAGAMGGLLVWFLITIVISKTIAYFYPGGTSSVVGYVPSDESCFTICVLFLILPFAALLGVLKGVACAQIIEAWWVRRSLVHGLITTYREDGTRWAEKTYHQGVAHGLYRDFWSNGNIACEGQYVDGTQDGEWMYYNPDSSLRETIIFSAGREIQV